MKRAIIRTGARLHLGLLDTDAPFGGLGVMVNEPETIVQFTESNTLQLAPMIATRGTEIVQRFLQVTDQDHPPGVAIRAIQSAPAHCGFGSGTQLSMAIAEGLCRFVGIEPSFETLAHEMANRGRRSAVGIHGYFLGGLIYETGDRGNGGLNRVEERIELCDEWRVVLVRPIGLTATFGEEERRQFQQLSRPDHATRTTLRRLIEAEILPAARSADFPRFAEGVERYNHASGMMFSSTQGGAYNGPRVMDLIQRLKRLKAPSVGQTSWGPCVFAWMPHLHEAESLARELLSDEMVVQVVRPINRGRKFEMEPG